MNDLRIDDLRQVADWLEQVGHCSWLVRAIDSW